MITHEDLNDRLGRGEARFTVIEGKLDAIASALDTLPDMARKIDETRDIVEAWHAVKTGGKFLKWLGGIAVAIAAIWAILKGMLAQILAIGVR